MRILVINCGSTTLKYKLFEGDQAGLAVLAADVVPGAPPEATVLRDILADLPVAPEVVAHRIVHGGDRFTATVRVDDEILKSLARLTPLAPLHNGPALRVVEFTRSLGIPVVAAFDSAFFADLPARSRRYALPPIPGVRRYGFHGWSHRSVAQRFAAIAGSATPSLITL
ncbi:MAG TPA: hypothetical protein VFU40_02640, partial [Gemmatimonadales bacterium]|nr:hypothetical protein [Gemmatimonadales bacterium]